MTLSLQQLSGLLAELQAQDQNQSGWVPAGAVEPALRRANIVTSAQQDEALLLLLVNAETGMVGYSRLRDEVELASRKVPSEPIATISQQDLVFKLLGELRELFNSFDLGGISVQGLKDGLARLGLRETQALRELLRHSYEMTFHQLVSALTRVDERETPVESLSKTQLNRGRNIFDEERTAEQRARKPVSIGKTLQSDHVPLPHRHPDPENRDENMLSGDRSSMNPTDTFTTMSQISSSPVRGRTAPLTSAGYDTRDKGLLRQQVHAVIRRLDAGEYDGRMFVRRLSELGVSPLPEVAQKLLDRQISGAHVPFKEWVKAFEPFFEEKTFQDEQAEQQQAQTTSAMDPAGLDAKHARGGQFRPRQGGGIFGFDETPNERDAYLRRGPINRVQRSSMNILVPELYESNIEADRIKQQKASIRTTSAVSRPDFLCWTEQDHIQPPQQVQKPMRGWVTAHVDSRPPPFAREGDPIVARNVSGIDRTSGIRRQPGRTPFGTEADYASSFANAPTFG